MRKTYLYQYFECYPDRRVTINYLLNEAMPGLVDREKLTEMIAEGIADGWLTSTTADNTTYYMLKHSYHHE